MPKQYHQLFTVENGEFLYLGSPLPQKILDESKKVLEAHVIKEKTHRAIYERAIYSAATAFNGLEKGCSFMERFRNDSLEELMNPEHVKRRVAEAKLMYREDRFSGIIEELNGWTLNPEIAVDRFLESPHSVRHHYAETIKGVGYKVASMFYLCCGGTRLIVLDRHNLRQAKGLSSNLDNLVKEEYTAGKLRMNGSTKGRKIPAGPTNEDYSAIENEILGLMHKIAIYDKHPEFLDDDGFINGALITALFWWEALKMRKIKGAPHQQKLFPLLEFPSPFTE